MNEEAIKQAKDRLRRIIHTSRNTAYDLVYSEIDIMSTAILLDYIEELEHKLEGKDCVIETQAHNEEVNEEIIKKREEDNKRLRNKILEVEEKRLKELLDK